MKKNLFNHCLLIALVLYSFTTGCSPSYLHPMFGGSTAYHVMPLKSDSVHTGLYASGNLVIGAANELADEQVYGQANMYVSHQFGFFNAWYGLNFSAGNYRLSNDENVSTQPYRRNQSFGSWGGGAGINGTVPLKRRGRNKGEWRFLGVQGTFQKDFGNYLDFRKAVDPSMAENLVTSDKLNTMGLYTELVMKNRRGYVSILLQYNFLLGADYTFIDDTYYDYSRTRRYGYFSPACHFNFGRTSAVVQLNIGNRGMFNTMFGFNYRIAGIKRKEK